MNIDEAITELGNRLDYVITGLGYEPEDVHFAYETVRGKFHVVAEVPMMKIEESVCVVLDDDPCPEFCEVILNRFRGGIFGSAYMKQLPRKVGTRRPMWF